MYKYNALGGPAVLSFLAQGVLVIAVKDNQTTMKVDPAEIACKYLYVYSYMYVYIYECMYVLYVSSICIKYRK